MKLKFQKEILVVEMLSRGLHKKKVERRNEGNPKYSEIIPYWYKRNAQRRRHEQKSNFGTPHWYKRQATIQHAVEDRRSDGRSNGLREHEETITKRGNEACVMHYNERVQTWCCTICKYCGKPVVKHC